MRGAVLESLGHIYYCMSGNKITEQLPKILSTMLTLYRRHPEPYHITKAIGIILNAVENEGIPPALIDLLLTNLFSQV